MRKIVTLFLLLVFLLKGYNTYAQLTGTYTIDASQSASTSNYKDFTSAVSDLVNGTRTDGGTANGPGITTAVIFNAADGVYREQVTIDYVQGSSNTNTITFQSASLDSSKVKMIYGGGGSNFLWNINQANYIILQYMTLERDASGNNSVVMSLTNTHDITIAHNRIIGMPSDIVWNPNACLIENATNSIDSNLTISGNYLQFGSVGIGISGFKGYVNNKLVVTNSNNIIIENNTLNATLSMGIQLYVVSNGQIKNNIVTNVSISQQNPGRLFAVGIGLFSVSKISCSSNTVYMPDLGTGIYAFGTDTLEIYNNFVTSWGDGIDIEDNKHVTDIHHNTILVLQQTYKAWAVFVLDSCNFMNNIVVNLSPDTNNFLVRLVVKGKCDYNNYYMKGGRFKALYNSSSNIYTNLQQWQAASGKDLHSTQLDPMFLSDLDLHIRNPKLNNTGFPISYVKSDFDGETRDTINPDVGADEINPYHHDIEMLSIDSPTAFCGGTTPIYITLRNIGFDTIKTFNIKWTVNGTTQTSYIYTGNLAPIEIAQLNIGSYNIQNGSLYDIKIYTDSIDGFIESSSTNDTITKKITTGMNGTYTIGGNNPDYKTFSAAAKDINSRGVCGPVIFKVRDGYYEEQITFDSIGGSSSVNTLTIQSESGDSSKVVLNWPAAYIAGDNNEKNYTLLLNGTDWLTVKNITISRIGECYFGTVVMLVNQCDHNTFLNNRIIGAQHNTSVYIPEQVVFSSEITSDSYNNISNNYISNGCGSIVFNLPTATFISTLVGGKNNIVSGNIIDSAYYRGIVLINQINLKVTENTISNMMVHPSMYNSQFYSAALWLKSCKEKTIIAKNRIYTQDAVEGVWGYDLKGSVNDTIQVNNNIVYLPSKSFHRGVEFTDCNYMNIYHNSFCVNGTLIGVCLNLYQDTNIQLYNNNLVQMGSGYLINDYSTITGFSMLKHSDYNNFYAPHGYITRYTKTFNDWKTTYKIDSKSVSVDPLFWDSFYLKPVAKGINNKGINLYNINDDYFNKTRTTPPDIGAVEFEPFNDDISLSTLANPTNGDCGDSNTSVSVVIENLGLNDETNFNIYIDISGTASASFSKLYTDTIHPGQKSTVTFSTNFNSYSGGIYLIKAYTSLSSDSNKLNDTLITDNFTISAHDSDPIISNWHGCPNSVATVYSTPAVGSQTYWYSNASGGTSIHIGDTFQIQLKGSTNIYYAQSKVLQYSVGPKDTATGTVADQIGGFLTTNFDAIYDLSINYITVYPVSSGTVVIRIEDYLGQVVATREIPVQITKPGQKVKISVNIFLPASYSYRLYTDQSTTGGFYYSYNKNGLSFPYQDMAGLISINNAMTMINMATSTSISGYIFDWIISPKLSCPSRIVPVVLSADTILAKTAPSQTYICLGDSIKFIDSSLVSKNDSIIGTTLDLGDGTFISNTPTVWHMYAKAGTYKLQYIISSSSGCSDTQSLNITVYDRPKANFVYAGNCERDAIKFTDLSTGTINKWEWNFGDGTTDTASNAIKIYNNDGNYFVRLKTISDKGCSDSLQVKMDIYPKPKLGFQNSGNFCLNELINFTDTSTIASGSIIKRFWDMGDGSNYYNISFQKKYTNSGNYIISLKDRSDKGCTDSTSKSISIYELPLSTFSYSKIGANNINFNPDDTNAINYIWDFGDGNNANTKSPNHLYSFSGTYIVKLKVINTNGCVDSSVQTVIINTGISISSGASFDLNVYPNPSENIFNIIGSAEQGGKIYLKVTDMLGNILVQQGVMGCSIGFNMSIDLSKFAKGMYLLYISSFDNHNTAPIKLIKE